MRWGHRLPRTRSAQHRHTLMVSPGQARTLELSFKESESYHILQLSHIDLLSCATRKLCRKNIHFIMITIST